MLLAKSGSLNRSRSACSWQTDLRFPTPCMLYDRFDIRVLRGPFEDAPGETGIGDQTRRIALPSGRIDQVELAARDALHRRDDLQHRESAAIAQVERTPALLLVQELKRRDVRLAQIHHMNVVPNTRAVWRVVIPPEDMRCLPPS